MLWHESYNDIILYIHDNVRWKERKKERKTPEANEKNEKWVASGGVHVNVSESTLYVGMARKKNGRHTFQLQVMSWNLC